MLSLRAIANAYRHHQSAHSTTPVYNILHTYYLHTRIDYWRQQPVPETLRSAVLIRNSKHHTRNIVVRTTTVQYRVARPYTVYPSARRGRVLDCVQKAWPSDLAYTQSATNNTCTQRPTATLSSVRPRPHSVPHATDGQLGRGGRPTTLAVNDVTSRLAARARRAQLVFVVVSTSPSHDGYMLARSTNVTRRPV